MSRTVAEALVDVLEEVGVKQIFGLIGDSLNPLGDAVRQSKIEWVGVRHEEGAALAAAGQAKLTGQLAVCAGTTGLGSTHLVAGLYEAARDHAPVLALSGEMPRRLKGIDYQQYTEPDLLFRDVSDDAVFVFDTGLNTLWSGNWIRQNGKQRITGSFNNAAVGTALGQANGIQALDRVRQVIVLTGDGGFNMLMGEFLTAVHHRLPVKVFVFDNAAFGLITLEAESVGILPFHDAIEFPNPDYSALARACGAQGFTVRDPALLEARGTRVPGPGNRRMWCGI